MCQKPEKNEMNRQVIQTIPIIIYSTSQNNFQFSNNIYAHPHHHTHEDVNLTNTIYLTDDDKHVPEKKPALPPSLFLTLQKTHMKYTFEQVAQQVPLCVWYVCMY